MGMASRSVVSRGCFLSAALILMLTGCAGASNEFSPTALDKACLDNRDRAFGAAEVVRQEADKGTADSTVARPSIARYVAEVRRVPDCFADEVREQVDEADAALKAGRVLDLGPRPPAQQ